MTTHTVHPDDVRVVPEFELCDRLRRSLRMLPLSNAEVAEIMGVRRETVSTWLTGQRKPSHTTLMIWADMTGVDLGWLETGTASPEAGRSLYAIRDSNPEPADMSSRRHLTLVGGGNRGLPVDRIPAGLPIPAPPHPLPGRESAARLWAVS
jgi:transcriptional regulator with XRE-family HTH domain